MKIDFYGLRERVSGLTCVRCINHHHEPDLEHELPREVAVTKAKIGDVVLVKIWLRTDGVAQLEELDAKLAEALAPLGLV